MSFQNSKGTGVGGVSILIVFVTLCLVIFGALALLSARSDLTLAERSHDATVAYYNSDALAQSKIAQIADALRALAQDELSTLDEDVYFSAVHERMGSDYAFVTSDAGRTLSFAEPIDDVRTLYVRLAPTPLDGGFAIEAYTVVADGDWTIPDLGGNFFTGQSIDLS